MYGTRIFITVSTKIRHFSPILRQINTTHKSEILSLRFILILFFYLFIRIPRDLLSSHFPKKTLNSRPNIEYFSLLTTPAVCQFYPNLFDLIAQTIFLKSTKRETLHDAVLSKFLSLFLLRHNYFPRRLILEHPPHMSLSK